MTEENENNDLEAAPDEAALNEEASRELEAMVAGEAPADDAETPEQSGTYVVQSAAERRSIVEALIFVSEEPLSAKIIAEVLREDRAVVEGALASRTGGCVSLRARAGAHYRGEVISGTNVWRHICQSCELVW